VPNTSMKINWANVRHYRYSEGFGRDNLVVYFTDNSQAVWEGPDARAQHEALVESAAVAEGRRDRAVLQLPSVTLNLNYVAMVRWEHEDIEDTLRAIVVLVCQDPEEDGGTPTTVRLTGSEALLLRELLGGMSA
jgi:hypothetical protein